MLTTAFHQLGNSSILQMISQTYCKGASIFQTVTKLYSLTGIIVRLLILSLLLFQLQVVVGFISSQTIVI